MNKDSFFTTQYKGVFIHTCHNRDTNEAEVKCDVGGVDLKGKSLTNMKRRVRAQLLDNTFIYTLVTEKFERTDSGKSWRSKPFEIERKKITQENYHNYTSDDTQRFFRRLGGSETAERCYTKRGYIVTRLTSINPDRTLKIVRTFETR